MRDGGVVDGHRAQRSFAAGIEWRARVLQRAVNKALQEENMAETYQRIDMVVEGSSPEDLGGLDLQDVQRWQKVAQKAGLVLD